MQGLPMYEGSCHCVVSQIRAQAGLSAQVLSQPLLAKIKSLVISCPLLYAGFA